MSTITRPICRYHGGKWRLAPWVISHFPTHRVYVEPYGGAASILLRKPRVYSEVYNDLGDEIWNVFYVIRRYREELERLLRETPYSRKEFELAYQDTHDPIERARRCIVRSHMGFGSASYLKEHRTGFRSNALRSGTTPAHDWMNYPDLLEHFEDRLRGVCLENRPAAKVMQQHDTPETLHYLDPPYVQETRNNSSDCYEHEMDASDYTQLRKVCDELEGMIVLSGYKCELIDTLFGEWKCIQKKAMASSQSSSVPRVECLWMNEAAQKNQEQQSLFA